MIAKHLKFTNNKTMLAGIAALGLTATLTAVSFIPRGANGEFDLTALQQQVQDNTDQLKNHEARISNTEKDVRDLQSNTNTPPASDKTSVPPVTSSTPTGTGQTPNTPPAGSTQPTTPVLVSTRKTVVENGSIGGAGAPYYDVVCFYTYDSGPELRKPIGYYAHDQIPDCPASYY